MQINNMNLEVGMYIRPKDGLDGIGILKEIDGLSLKVEFKNYVVTNTANHYKKASYEPIDLIEVGDYVNGCKVEADDLLGKYIVIYESEERKYKRMYLGRSHIGKIVTKEQFEHIDYDIA